MKKITTTKSFTIKLTVLLSLLAFISHFKTYAQIEFEKTMPEDSPITSVKSQIGGLIILNGFFDIDGGLNKIPSFNLPAVNVFDKNNFNAFNMHMRLSILRFVNEFKLKNGETITTKVEGDFNGPGPMETISTFRLRHINVRYRGWTIGQDWSTFGDTGAMINTLDADGPSIGLGFRKPLIRYTFNYSQPVKIELALEQPLIDYKIADVTLIDNDNDAISDILEKLKGVNSVTQYFPELMGAVEYTFGNSAYLSHVRFAAVYRKLNYARLHDDKSHTDYATSWGTSLSSKINLNEIVGLILQGNLGKGIGIYTSSFAGGGYDGFVTNNRIETLPTYGGFAAVEVLYTKTSPLSSTFAIGYSNFKVNALNNYELTASGYYGPDYGFDKFKSPYNPKYNKLDIGIPYASANLMYNILDNFIIGAEVNWGIKHLTTKSDDKDLPNITDSKKALRLTFGMIYKL